MPREFSRSRRLEEAIQRILGELLAGQVRDPRLAGVVVTDVQVTRDLSLARVYFTTLAGTEPTAEVQAGLQAAAGFFRSRLAAELRIRKIPELRFMADLALTRGRALEALIAAAVAGDEEQPTREGRSGPSGRDGN